MQSSQNIMYPHPYLYNSYHQKQNSYQNQPVINIPTRPTTSTIGEVGASVELVRAQLAELSNRMEKMESTFSKFESSISNDLFLLKSTLSEHATELLHTRDAVESAFAHAKETNELIEQQNDCIDELAANVVTESQYCKKMLQRQYGIQQGIVRRRLSKIEDFTNEFYQHFESFKKVKDIFIDLSNKIEECDKDISSMVINHNINNNNNNDSCIVNDDTTFVDENIVDLVSYFSNYEEDVANGIPDDDFEKL